MWWLRIPVESAARQQWSIPYVGVVETLAAALDARDRYTAGHSVRVAEYSAAIAVELGFSARVQEEIRVAAQMHDLGKIGIPDAVLLKSGKLTAEELGLIRLHPQIGRRILERAPNFEGVLNVVELHHENYDGSGYPYRLAGEGIPLDARIVRVADALDAMTSHRSYGTKLSPESASEELQINAGRLFDPNVVRALLRLMQGPLRSQIESVGTGLRAP